MLRFTTASFLQISLVTSLFAGENDANTDNAIVRCAAAASGAGSSLEGGTNEWQNPFAAFAPSRADLYTEKPSALSAQLKQKTDIDADLKNSERLLQGDNFKKYRRNPRQESPDSGYGYYYSSVDAIQKMLADGLPAEAPRNHPDLALKHLHEKIFAKKRERTLQAKQALAKSLERGADNYLNDLMGEFRMELMAGSSGRLDMDRNPSGGFGWFFPLFFTRDVTPEQRLELAIMARQYGHGDLGDRIVAWQMMRLNDLDSAYKYFEKYYVGRGRYPAGEGFQYERPTEMLFDFTTKYLATLPGFDPKEMTLTFFNNPVFYSVMMDKQVWPAFKAKVEKNEFPEANFELIVKDMFAKDRRGSDREALLKNLFKNNMTFLDLPIVSEMMGKYPEFQKWIMELVS